MRSSAVMEQPVRKRAGRSDAGQVRETARDSRALTWLSQMYGAPLDVVARVLGTSEAGARNVARRWVQDAKWAERGRVDAGPEWLWPKAPVVNRYLREGEADSAYGAWGPSPTMAAHTRAVAEVRLALGGDAVDNWISERVLAHREHGLKERGRKLDHLPDGVWLRGGVSQTDNVVIEVELTAKSVERTQRNIDALRKAARKRRAGEIWFICGSDHVVNVVTRAGQALAAEHSREWVDGLKVMRLDEVIGGVNEQ